MIVQCVLIPALPAKSPVAGAWPWIINEISVHGRDPLAACDDEQQLTPSSIAVRYGKELILVLDAHMLLTSPQGTEGSLWPYRHYPTGERGPAFPPRSTIS